MAIRAFRQLAFLKTEESFKLNKKIPVDRNLQGFFMNKIAV